MSQECVELFLGRIITDDAFRRMAMGSMPLAAAANDFKFTRQEIEALMLIDSNIVEMLSRELDKSIKRNSNSLISSESVGNVAVMAERG
jgi:hypothetical protein